MEYQATTQMRLYNKRNERLYLNASELRRFIAAAYQAPPEQRLFALTLVYTGMRLSEARALRHDNIQHEERVLSVRSLKKRDKHVMREIPIPPVLLNELGARQSGDALLFADYDRPINRITAYRWIKKIMAAADIHGAKACPKGLRHAFGVRAVLSNIPLHMIQLWMGHASIRTTAIYTTVMGEEQLLLCDQMWC